MNDMQKFKDKALKEEDYEALKTLGTDLRKVFNIGKEIWALKNSLKICLAQEDFTKAITLKQSIKRVMCFSLIIMIFFKS